MYLYGLMFKWKILTKEKHINRKRPTRPPAEEAAVMECANSDFSMICLNEIKSLVMILMGFWLPLSDPMAGIGKVVINNKKQQYMGLKFEADVRNIF